MTGADKSRRLDRLTTDPGCSWDPADVERAVDAAAVVLAAHPMPPGLTETQWVDRLAALLDAHDTDGCPTGACPDA